MVRQRKKKTKILKCFIRLIAYLCWFGALGVILYPWISNLIYEKNVQSGFETYQSEIMNQLWEQELKEAEQYNLELSEKGSFYYDAFDNEVSEEEERYRILLNADDEGMMGYLEIPDISAVLPIYHGTSEEVLGKGCGHMEGSSLPVGGSSSHAVLCAHTGYGGADLFTDLDQLCIGAEFSISVFGRVIKYRVDQIKVVLPEEMESLYIVENEDYVTLVTCTPYGVNSHRLLVRGTRIN